MEPTSLPDAPSLEPSGATRRSFIRGIAAAGASTAAAVALDRAGVLNLATDSALAATPNDFSSFTAIAASAEDVVRVPDGFRADVLIRYGDKFANTDGTELTYGYNNDFLAFFPLPAGSQNANEGLLFINHEYPSPLLQHGQPTATQKTKAQVEIERESVGNSILHVKKDAKGLWSVVSPSQYNRRITGAAPELHFTGPLANNPAYPGIGASVGGSVANCSGGITPWGTALSCEENYQDYASETGFGYGWTKARLELPVEQYENGDGSTAATPAKYGWVVEHDPYSKELAAGQAGRKHTALGRFRHENTAFRARSGKPFVLYMGDDVNNGGVYKFVSTRAFDPNNREENLKILTEGKLYIARWSPESRRRFVAGALVTDESGTGYWREVLEEELVDTQARITANVTADEGATAFLDHYATNRPEDLEVDEDGTVYIALTNNSTVGDVHGSIRRLREQGNDATAVGPDEPFIWEDFAAGGPSGLSDPGRQGFSSPDNLVFDKAGNLWVVTDISSGTLNDPTRPQAFHGNNALFMVPRSGPNAGVAFRFANMPVQSEGTGPYFSPDESALFLNVQHPGENSTYDSNSEPQTFDGLTSYWPTGNKTAEQNPALPLPATVVISRVLPEQPPVPPVTPPPVTPAPPDASKPEIDLESSQLLKLGSLRRNGVRFTFEVNEASLLTVTLSARLRKTGRKAKGRGKSRRLARGTVRATQAGEVSVRLRPNAALRALLRRERELPATLRLEAVDAAGNRTTRTIRVLFR